MITEEVREKLIYIPFRNSKLIQGILKENNKEVYSTKYIANVFRGRYENLDIEEAYYILNKRMKAQSEKVKKLKAVTLSS